MSIPSLPASFLAVASAYLIGAIPFGFLIFYLVKGIDVRSVGSGNIGATNVGRNLGFRYFLLVFLLDMLKGFLPTLLLPLAVHAAAGQSPADLPVFLALAAILGHNFPIYLGFRGGKGVATSLGAVLALDPAATAAAVVGFGLSLLFTRYVSLSSLLGGLAFAAAHFLRVEDPWSLEHRGLSILTIALLILLVVRHRKNITRILNGTEPKVMNSRSRSTPKDQAAPRGSAAAVALCALIPIALLIVGGAWIVQNARTTTIVDVGPWTFRKLERVSTGLQRSERIEFTTDGGLLAVTCPRYQKLVIYRVAATGLLDRAAEVALDGRPVALAAGRDRFLVLQRPPGDRCHLEPGWFDVIGREGNRIGSKVVVGDYPDDLALAPDRKAVYVLSSGSGEGGPRKPRPRLSVFTAEPGLGAFAIGGHVEFESADDPVRLRVSRQGTCAVVLLSGRKSAPAFDLVDPSRPRRIGESALPADGSPELSASPFDGDAIVLPVETGSEAVVMDRLAGGAGGRETAMFACTNPVDSTIEITQPRRRGVIAKIPLRGAFNLGRAQPSGIAYSPDRNLIAVADRSGSVHLLAIETKAGASVAMNKHIPK